MENKMTGSCICRFLCAVFCCFLIVLLFLFLGGYIPVHFADADVDGAT